MTGAPFCDLFVYTSIDTFITRRLSDMDTMTSLAAKLKCSLKDMSIECSKVAVLLYECMGKNNEFEKLRGVVRKLLL